MKYPAWARWTVVVVGFPLLLVAGTVLTAIFLFRWAITGSVKPKVEVVWPWKTSTSVSAS